MATLRLVERLPASPERILQAWRDPARLASWFMGGWGRSGTIDLVPGGSYRVEGVTPSGKAVSISGSILDVQPRRLRFTFHWAGADDDPETQVAEADATPVDVSLREAGVGGTEIEIVHGGLASDESAEGYGFGWRSALEALRGILSPAPGPEP